MPNFGKLDHDLIGGTLSIGNKLVLDTNANLYVGNVTSGNVFGILFTSSIVEQDSMQGIQVYGNIHLTEGYSLTGNLALDYASVNTLYIATQASCTGNVYFPYINGGYGGSSGPLIRGNTIISGSLNINGTGSEINTPHLLGDTVEADALITNTISPKTNTYIDILGNVHLLEGTMYLGNIEPENSLLTLTGNLKQINGCITLAKDIVSADITNNVYTSTSAGLVNYYASSPIASLAEGYLRVHNTCITSNSVVSALVGNYTGNGFPFITKAVVNGTSGYVDLWFYNFSGSEIASTETVPIQYLIL